MLYCIGPYVLFFVYQNDKSYALLTFFIQVYDYALNQKLSVRRIGYEDNNDVSFHPDDSKRLIHKAESRLL